MAVVAGFNGPSNVLQSPIADCERTINRIPEIENVGTPKAQMVLLNTPGTRWFAPGTGEPNLGEFSQDGRAFFVGADANFYEVLADGTQTNRGTFTDGVTIASFAQNTTSHQLLIATGLHVYLYDLNANTLTELTAGSNGIPDNVIQVAYLDAYFIALQQATNTFFISALNDGSTWDPLDFFEREHYSDVWTSMIVQHLEVWLMGNRTTEVWVDTGDALIPFQPIPSVLMHQGSITAFGPQRFDNTIVWIGLDEYGKAVVFRADGYSPKKISSLAVDLVLQSPAYDINNVITWAYQENGHLFYVVEVPWNETTLVYDVSTNLWHERATLDATTGQWSLWQPRYQMQAFGRTLVGFNGTIADLSTQYQTEQIAPDLALSFTPESTKTTFFAGALVAMATRTLSANVDLGCVDLNNQVWLHTTDSGGSLKHVNPITGAVLATVTPAVTIGNTLDAGPYGNAFGLHVDPSDGHLITRRVSSGAIVKISSTSGAVLHTYGLTVSVFDGSVSSDGSTLYYTKSSGATIGRWDLVHDVALADFATLPGNVFWPSVLADGTLIVAFGTPDVPGDEGYLHDNSVWRLNTDGTFLQTFVTSASLLGIVISEGMYACAASAGLNRLWITYDADIGAASDDVPIVLEFDLTTGMPTRRLLMSELMSDLDMGSPMAAPIMPITITAAGTAPGPPYPAAPPPAVQTAPYPNSGGLAGSTYRPIGWLRVGPHLNQDKIRVTFSRFELDMDVGQGSDTRVQPYAYLGVSNDGGITWGAWKPMATGVSGQTTQRVFWTRLGQARDRVYRVSGYGFQRLIAAYQDVQLGTS